MKAAIVMISRGEDDKLSVTDGAGTEHEITDDAQLRRTLDGILDDPNLPQPEQVARLEQAAEQIVTQAAASLLPQVAKPLAAPLVRDLATLLGRMKESAVQRKAARDAARPPAPKRADGARTARITKSRVRLGTNVKRRTGAA